MRWVRFEYKSRTSVGTLEEETVKEYSGTDILSPGHPTGSVIPLSSVRLLSPVTPKSIVALWNNFHERAAQEGQAIPDFPLYFLKPTSSVVGPEDRIYRPLGKNKDDGAPVRVIYEAELGMLIGKRCSCVSESDALDYVFGYTCVNDVTAPRILFEFKSKVPFQQWSRSKGYDTFTPLGPVVTTDIAPDQLRVRVTLTSIWLSDRAAGNP